MKRTVPFTPRWARAIRHELLDPTHRQAVLEACCLPGEPLSKRFDRRRSWHFFGRPVVREAVREDNQSCPRRPMNSTLLDTDTEASQVKRHLALAAAMLLAASGTVWGDDSGVVVEHSKPIPRTRSGLGTTRYSRTPAEAKSTQAWSDAELKSGRPDTSSLKGLVGKRIAWFGIVREVVEETAKNETRLTVEMKYFDGLTDLHQQIVSIFGAGDFHVVIPGTGHAIKRLSLVRVYGEVASETDGIPTVAAQFVRVWDWKLFAFMFYGKDQSNPRWVKLRQVDTFSVYSSAPNEDYYELRLGKR
jgi:hypothetical protein